MNRTPEEWKALARQIKLAIDGCSTIRAINTLEKHSDPVLRDAKKASAKLHEHLIEYFDYRRVELARQVKKESVK